MRRKSGGNRRSFRLVPIYASVALVALSLVAGCRREPAAGVVNVYCAVNQPYAAKFFEDFERETGIRVAPLYDIESSKSVGLAGKLEAESDRPRADVWWGSEAFLTTRLAEEGIFAKYEPPGAADVLPAYKDALGFWTGVGVRARVLAVGQPVPQFPVKSIRDLLDPRLKGKICIARPTAGATGAHLAALYVVWGPEKAKEYLHKLHDNGVTLLGGNSEVADQVGAGSFVLGLTDSDAVTNSAENGGKLKSVVPDQDGEGTLAMPTTVALVKGAPHPELARKLIDYLLRKETEQALIDMHFAQWSVRAGAQNIKALDVDYRKAARVFGQAEREATTILEGR
jgi:iron(III) transport system substrate-binding protein